jgi:hypothetical protein
MAHVSVLGIRATVSGSFHRGLDDVQAAVGALIDAGVEVLSPADPRLVDAFGEFLFVASDRRRKIKMVQDRHLAAIAASHFLWLVAPDGYVGQSAALEVGSALAHGIPVFGTTPPNDLTLRQYVSIVSSVRDAVSAVVALVPEASAPGLLLDPYGVADRVHDQVDRIRQHLLTPSSVYGEDDPAVRSITADLRGELRGL